MAKMCTEEVNDALKVHDLVNSGTLYLLLYFQLPTTEFDLRRTFQDICFCVLVDSVDF